MRYTRTREQVFDFLSSNPSEAFNAYEIANSLDMNHVSVYRILEFLKEHKLVHYVPTLGKWIACSHQEESKKDHAFLVCKECKNVDEFLTTHTCSHQHGFHCEEHVSEVLGLCKNCYAATSRS